MGHRGSKKRGIATIERVAREGNWVKEDAKTLLIMLYKRENRFTDAVALGRELGAKYPRNYLYRLETAEALVSQAALERKANQPGATSAAETEAFATFETLLRDKTLRETAGKALDLIHFKYGEALMTAGQNEKAAKEFLAAASAPGAQQGLATMALLYAARAYGFKRQAQRRVDAVSRSPCASECLRRAPTGSGRIEGSRTRRRRRREDFRSGD